MTEKSEKNVVVEKNKIMKLHFPRFRWVFETKARLRKLEGG